uniref:DNA repair protein RAD51 homolog 2 n=2 Tax=Cyprinus carpio TaxID=7962 RepID=A0A8C1EH75_CYPCA
MASKKLRRTGVSAELCERLKRHQLETCQDVLSTTPVELMRLAGLSHPAALDLLQLLSKACAPAVSSAWDLWRKKGELCFSTSLPALDRLLRGGLPRGALTEVTGPSGCGKTQLCIMLSVLATLPRSMGGLDSGVIFIDTESAFSAERLVEMAQARFPEFFSVKERLLEMASRVHLFRELTCQDVLNRLEHLEEDIIACRAGLVILDSVASVVRKEFDTSLPGNLTFRSNLLGQEAGVLKYLSQAFCIPVVLTNQITTHVSEKVHCAQWNQADVSKEEDSGFVTAALGNTWSHSVNTRLIVQYEDTERRQIVIAKSPVAPFAMLSYTVQKEGIRLEGNENPESVLNQGTDPGLQPIRVRTGLIYNLSQATPSTC